MRYMNPNCTQCGELNTPDDCVCCRECKSHPCECQCAKCGEMIDESEYMDFCVCDTSETSE